MSKKTLDASVFYNGDFFEFITISRGMMGYADPDVMPKYLPPNSTDEEIGSAMRQALSHSKRISAAEFQALFKSGIVQKKMKEHEDSSIKEHGYKSRRALYLNMKNCTVSQHEDRIEVQPMHHNSIDGFSATKQDISKMLNVNVDASDSELGAAIKEGLCRCTSEWP